MTTLAIIGAIAMIVVSILIIVVVSLQEGKGDGITALAGVSAFLTDSNDRSTNAKLSKLTKERFCVKRYRLSDMDKLIIRFHHALLCHKLLLKKLLARTQT